MARLRHGQGNPEPRDLGLALDAGEYECALFHPRGEQVREYGSGAQGHCRVRGHLTMVRRRTGFGGNAVVQPILEQGCDSGCGSKWRGWMTGVPRVLIAESFSSLTENPGMVLQAGHGCERICILPATASWRRIFPSFGFQGRYFIRRAKRCFEVSLHLQPSARYLSNAPHRASAFGGRDGVYRLRGT